MTSEPINFHWLKTQAEKKQTIDIILACFKNRQIATQESAATIVERIMEDEDVNSADGIIREIENLCVPVWRDDLTAGDPYADILNRLNDIGKNALGFPHIVDNYSDSKRGDVFGLTLTAKTIPYHVDLKHGRFLDYNFLKVLIRAFKANNADGKFYVVSSETMDEGFALIYADADEYSAIIKSGVFELYELDESEIDSMAETHTYDETPKSSIAAAPEILEKLTSTATPVKNEEPIANLDKVRELPHNKESLDKPSQSGRFKFFAIPIAIILVVFSLSKIANRMLRGTKQDSSSHTVQTIPSSNSEQLALERRVAAQIVGDPSQITKEKFEYIHTLNEIAQEQYLKFYHVSLRPQNDPEYKPLMAYSPDGIVEITSRQEFDDYAETYFGD